MMKDHQQQHINLKLEKTKMTQNIKYGSNTTLKEFIKKFHHDKLLRELEYVEKKLSEREHLFRDDVSEINQP